VLPEIVPLLNELADLIRDYGQRSDLEKLRPSAAR
jgi:hypothetical protein